MERPCVVCGSEQWAGLVDPHPTRSVRVDGVMEPSPLRRRHCKVCGLGYRAPIGDLALLYRKQYALYSNRPGAEAFNSHRHPALVQLIAAAVDPLRPRRILEIGCGDGGALSAIRKLWPHSETVGAEPSREAADAARTRGHRVIEEMVESSLRDIREEPFELIFSIHVIEHTADPIAFLAAQAACLAAGGIVVTICPNGAVPHAEIIHSDHVFSFAPRHLAAVAAKAGLLRRGGHEFVLDEAREFNQLLVATAVSDPKLREFDRVPLLDQDEVDHLEQKRNAYLRRWSSLEEKLDERMREGETLVSFGTGGWSGNLAGYAPAIWDRVRACTVDDPEATNYLNKPVIKYSNLRDLDPDAVLVAVNPGQQDRVCQRLRRDGYHAVQWNDLIDR
ncbi:class I SAM-dependent methyltransferase [Nitrospira sp. Nam80]